MCARGRSEDLEDARTAPRFANGDQTIEQHRSHQGRKGWKKEIFIVKKGNHRMTGNDCEHEMPGRIFNPYLIDTSKGLK